MRSLSSKETGDVCSILCFCLLVRKESHADKYMKETRVGEGRKGSATEGGFLYLETVVTLGEGRSSLNCSTCRGERERRGMQVPCQVKATEGSVES